MSYEKKFKTIDIFKDQIQIKEDNNVNEGEKIEKDQQW